MGKLDPKAIKKEKDERSGGAFFIPKEGEYLLYLAPPCREEDNKNYVPVTIHYGLGPRGIPGLCLDIERCEIIKDPRAQEAIKGAKSIDIAKEAKGGCGVCKKVYSNTLPKKESDDMKPSSRFLFGVIPVKFRPLNATEWQDLPPKFQRFNVSYTQWDRITDLECDIGDPTDPNAAVLIKLKRSGTKKTDTKYDYQADVATLKEPMKLSKPMRATLMQAQEIGQNGDLYRAVADFAKTAEELEALATGIQVEQQQEAKDEDGHNPCYGTLFDAEDSDCKGCTDAEGCEKAMGGDVAKAEPEPEPEPEAESGDELDELEAQLKKRSKKTKQPKK